MLVPIKRRKLFREIANEIAKSIRHGTYTIGDELPSEREMMRDFAVGRPAVREALLILEAQGLVAIRHGDQPTRAGKLLDPVQYAKSGGEVRAAVSIEEN